MTADLEPLAPDVRALLDRVEGEPQTIPPEVQAQIRHRLEIAVLAAASAPGLPAPRLPRWNALRQILSLGVAAAVGGAATHFVEKARERPNVQIVQVFADAGPLPAPASEKPPEQIAPAPSALLPPTPMQPPSASASRPAVRDSDLAVEGRIIDTARAALTHGDYPAALAAVGRHAKTYPAGRLAEEREAIAVQALAGAGRTSEALARAKDFRAAFPHSLFLPLVDAAVEAGANP